jgi:hypothetical protein
MFGANSIPAVGCSGPRAGLFVDCTATRIDDGCDEIHDVRYKTHVNNNNSAQ